ncbi:MAG TPA: efflux transporter outer membrane subunit [Edaphobacter sp.]|nr:efflux transporter outer membrane subunit [Edaphobacter sp.]
MKHSLLIVGTLASTLCVSGCMVGPRYQRPAVNSPDVFSAATPPEVTSQENSGQVISVEQLTREKTKAASLGDEKWAEVFKDPGLQQLIREALANNYDVNIAAQRVLEQQDQVGITRSQQFPILSGGGSYTALGLPRSLAKSLTSGNNGKGYNSSYFAGGFSLSAAWNLDFWGLYRRQTEAARARLLATEWGRRMTISTVVENVATGYLQLRTLDAELEITKKTLEARKHSLQLTETLEQGGSGTLADVRQAEQLLYTAAAAIPDFERQIEQEENSISILLGRNPGPILRGATEEMSWPQPEQIPSGIPSQLLERRPDIQQAEAELVAANADVGVAKAQLFPQLSLSGMGGVASSQLQGLVDGKNAYWLASGSLTQPIFDAGKLRNNLRLSEAQKQEDVLAYQRTIKEAFRSVSDALIGLEKFREFRVQEANLTVSAEDATRLAKLRYNGGSTSYIEVLTNDTNYYSAQLNLVVAQENEALSIVQLYSALGGGWQE